METAFRKRTSAIIILCAFLLMLLMQHMMTPPPQPHTYDWSSNLEGWYERAKPHPSPHSIDLTKRKILIASQYSAQVGEGFNMALFELENQDIISVDARGKVLILDTKDVSAFTTLLGRALSLPTREYRIWHLITCLPFQIVSVAAPGDKFEKFQIYGYKKSMRDLEENAGQLPYALWELFGVIEEASAAWTYGEERDYEVLNPVKQRLQIFDPLQGIDE